jgi:uncharacterized protein
MRGENAGKTAVSLPTLARNPFPIMNNLVKPLHTRYLTDQRSIAPCRTSELFRKSRVPFLVMQSLFRRDLFMSDMSLFMVLSAAVFAGAFVSGLAGFAFSAVAAAILLHVFPPMEAVPLMMACSIVVQAANLFALRNSMQWKGSLVFIIGGLLGIPIAIFLLQNVDTRTIRMVFGAVVALYATYALFRPTLTQLREMENQSRNALVGFGVGLIGGLTAMPGALPTIWCDMHGLPKSQQRGLVQPFIAVMQLFALALMLPHHSLSSKVFIDFGICVPALAAGTAVGIIVFGRINELAFKRIILALLLFSGLCLLV